MKKNTCVIIPCYKVKKKILSVFNKINFKIVDKVIIVDDCCPEKSGNFIKKKIKNKKKVDFIFLKKNLGVGGATLKGFNLGSRKGYKILIKIDGDGQHEAKNIKEFRKILNKDKFEFCQGYRNLELLDAIKNNMPLVRFFGTQGLTLLSRIASNNWSIKDATNGFIGIKSSLFRKIDQSKIRKNYFFEQDLIFNIALVSDKTTSIKIKTIYEDENSSLEPMKSVFPFFYYHLSNFLTRLIK